MSRHAPRRFSLAAAGLALAASVLSSLPASAQDGMVWEYHRYVEANPLDTYLGLSYGIPQTDAVRAWSRCNIGANWVYGALTLAYDVSNLSEGDNVEVEIMAPGYAMYHDAMVVKPDEGTWGISVALDLSDPLWGVMAGQNRLTYQVPGGAVEHLPLSGLASHMGRYISDCSRIGDLRG